MQRPRPQKLLVRNDHVCFLIDMHVMILRPPSHCTKREQKASRQSDINLIHRLRFSTPSSVLVQGCHDDIAQIRYYKT